MSGYNCWTKYGERRVMLEDNDDNYPLYLNTAIQEDKEEEEAEERASYVPADDLGQVMADAQIDCESEK
jgi:hypothetical protein